MPSATSPSEATGRVDRVLVAEPRGFCAGVEMAIKALTWLVRAFDEPVYCYHEIVHNKLVVERFEALGVVFVDDIADVPAGAPLMLSAHGSAPEVVRRAREVGGYTIDAVCPLVTKVHHEVRTRADKGYQIVYVGHAGPSRPLRCRGGDRLHEQLQHPSPGGVGHRGRMRPGRLDQSGRGAPRRPGRHYRRHRRCVGARRGGGSRRRGPGTARRCRDGPPHRRRRVLPAATQPPRPAAVHPDLRRAGIRRTPAIGQPR